MSLLKPIFENKISSILKLQVDMESIDDAYKKYNNAILDIFGHQLSVEESGELLGSFVDHNLKYEYRYLRFMEDVYKLNNSMPVIVDTHLNNLDSIDILRLLETLDYHDKLLLMDIIRCNERAHLFLIENKEILSLFVKLSTRELLFSIFHFTYAPIAIVGSFDLSFPVFYGSEQDFKKYLNIATKNDLSFRNMNIMS